MTRKLNCWEFKNCGREKGGLLADILGECPVSRAMEFDGLNGGVGAGRACWMASAASARPVRLHPCLGCEFYQRVTFEEEEKAHFTFASSMSEST